MDEEGTEAAAATAVMMWFGCAAPADSPIPVICDHPFLFVLRDKEENVPLFMGRFASP